MSDAVRHLHVVRNRGVAGVVAQTPRSAERPHVTYLPRIADVGIIGLEVRHAW